MNARNGASIAHAIAGRSSASPTTSRTAAMPGSTRMAFQGCLRSLRTWRGGGVDRVVTETISGIPRSHGEASAIQQGNTLAGARSVTPAAADGDAADITVTIGAFLDTAVHQDRNIKTGHGKRVSSAASPIEPEA